MLTIDIKDLLICALIFAAILLAIFAMVAVVRFARAAKKLDKILADMEIVSNRLSKRTTQLDDAFESLIKTFTTISRKIGESRNILAIAPIVIRAFRAVAGAFKGEDKKEKEESKK